MWGWFQSASSSHAYEPVRDAESVRSSVAGTRDFTTLHIDSRQPALAHAREMAEGGIDSDDDGTPSPGALQQAKDASKAAISKVKDFFGLRAPIPESERTYADELDEFFSLTREQRLYGFVIFFAVGWLLSLMSLVAVGQIALHPEKFALLYTVGNLVSICSTMCLWGPCAQLRDMFAAKRCVATSVYLVSMLATLVCAFHLRSLAPTLIALLVQMAAMAWYCLSYFPYGQEILAKFVTSCCCPCLT